MLWNKTSIICCLIDSNIQYGCRASPRNAKLSSTWALPGLFQLPRATDEKLSRFKQFVRPGTTIITEKWKGYFPWNTTTIPTTMWTTAGTSWIPSPEPIHTLSKGPGFIRSDTWREDTVESGLTGELCLLHYTSLCGWEDTVCLTLIQIAEDSSTGNYRYCLEDYLTRYLSIFLLWQLVIDWYVIFNVQHYDIQIEWMNRLL